MGNKWEHGEQVGTWLTCRLNVANRKGYLLKTLREQMQCVVYDFFYNTLFNAHTFTS